MKAPKTPAWSRKWWRLNVSMKENMCEFDPNMGRPWGSGKASGPTARAQHCLGWRCHHCAIQVSLSERKTDAPPGSSHLAFYSVTCPHLSSGSCPEPSELCPHGGGSHTDPLMSQSTGEIISQGPTTQPRAMLLNMEKGHLRAPQEAADWFM